MMVMKMPLPYAVKSAKDHGGDEDDDDDNDDDYDRWKGTQSLVLKLILVVDAKFNMSTPPMMMMMTMMMTMMMMPTLCSKERQGFCREQHGSKWRPPYQPPSHLEIEKKIIITVLKS